MPKVPRISEGSHGGCVVSGRVLRVDGTPDTSAVEFTPRHGGLYHGIMYAPATVRVVPNESGNWTVVLLPSSVVGKYHVRVGLQNYRVDVPDQVTARFEDISEVAKP